MPWVWRPLWGPVWINDSGTKEKNRKSSPGKGKRVDKTIEQAPGPNNAPPPDPRPGEIIDNDERARGDLSMATGNNRPVTCGERYRERAMKVFIGSPGPNKRYLDGNDIDNSEVDNEEKEFKSGSECSGCDRSSESENATCESSGEKSGINEGELAVRELLEKSIQRQFDEVQPGVFQFKILQQERRGPLIMDKNVHPAVPESESNAAIPTFMKGFTIIGYTKEGSPVYTMR